jgi:membrane protein DedA with SNARE-associated domain
MELERLIAEYGGWFYLFTFIGTFFEGETFVLAAGFLAAQDILNGPVLFLCAWMGSFCGDQCYFWAGRHFGPRLLRRFPRWRPRVDAAFVWLKRYNTFFILSFRFIYGVRNFASFALGMSGLDWRRFLVLNFIAAGFWAASFVGAGYAFGHVFREIVGVEHVARNFTLVVLAVFVLMFGLTFVIHRVQRRRLGLPPGAAAQVSPPN